MFSSSAKGSPLFLLRKGDYKRSLPADFALDGTFGIKNLLGISILAKYSFCRTYEVRIRVHARKVLKINNLYVNDITEIGT